VLHVRLQVAADPANWVILLHVATDAQKGPEGPFAQRCPSLTEQILPLVLGPRATVLGRRPGTGRLPFSDQEGAPGSTPGRGADPRVGLLAPRHRRDGSLTLRVRRSRYRRSGAGVVVFQLEAAIRQATRLTRTQACVIRQVRSSVTGWFIDLLGKAAAGGPSSKVGRNTLRDSEHLRGS
jgi:hypothetical protein